MGVPVSEDFVEGYAGDEWNIEVEFFNASNLPVDLSGFSTFRSEWRVRENNPFNVKELELNLAELASGKIRILVTAAQTATMNSNGVIDIMADERQTLIKFPTKLTEDVTL